MQAPSLSTILPTHVQDKDAGFQANPALIKINSLPNVPIGGPEKSDHGPQGSPPPGLPPSNPPVSNAGSGSVGADAINPGVTFSLLP